MEPLVLPPLGAAELRRWGVVGVVVSALLAGAAWRLTEAGPWLLALPVGLLLGLLWLGSGRVHVDADAGILTVARPGRRRTTGLADAEWVHLADVGSGCMALLVMPTRGSHVRVGVLVVSRWVEECRDSAELRVLATVLERHARTDDPLAAVLRLQADHLERGGEVAASPLAGVVLRPRSRRGPGEGSSSALARLLD